MRWLTRAGAMLRLIPHTHPDQDDVRRWVPDGHHVRMVLPWHGPASWQSMHDYVSKVIAENTVPSPGYVPRAGIQADRLARCILLSLCRRLAVEPTGAFIRDVLELRCPSCEHTAGIHSDDGCWFTVTSGRPDKNAVCQCCIPRQELTEGE